MSNNGTILSISDLRTYFQTEDGLVKAVDGISFELKKGETLGIVGESGSGKSVTNLSVMRLIPEPPGKIVDGSIVFDGVDVRSLSIDDVRKIRGKRIAMIFQDPMTSLNPFLKISTQLMEVTRLHLGHTKRQAYDHAVKMLKTVGISDAEERINSYPHEFSGGMRQRVMIAMALSCDPELLIADEPTTALDVTIQAQILELIKDLKARMGTSVILITHDLGVVAGMTDKIIVMYAGKVFEQAPTRELFATPANPYTKGLLKSVPDPAHEQGKNLYQIPGLPPDVAHLPPGCPFAERCERAEDICRREFSPFVEINEGHHSLCHFAADVYAESTQKRPEGKTMKKITLILVLLACAGFGCKYFESLKGAGSGGGSGTASSDPKADLIAASRKFMDLKSFSAKMEGFGQSEIKSQVDFIAPDRFHISYLGGTGAGMEMIMIGNQSYMKTGGTWMKMPGDSNKSIPNLRDSFTEEGLKSLSDVKFEGDDTVDGKPALVYSYSNVTPVGNYPFTSKMWVGKSSGLPIKIYVEYSNGVLKHMTINYDTESPVTIEPPVK